MSDNKPGTGLTAEELKSISGGCSAEEWLTATEQFKEAYETLVDLASHIIERVAGGNP